MILKMRSKQKKKLHKQLVHKTTPEDNIHIIPIENQLKKKENKKKEEL